MFVGEKERMDPPGIATAKLAEIKIDAD